MKDTTIDILLIEDNLQEADLIKEMLSEVQGQKYSVEHVQYLPQGLDLLRGRRFDVILLDLGHSGCQGLETVVMLRDQDKRTPVMVLTSLDDEELVLKTLEIDIQDYLVKSEITSSILRRSILYAIKRKHISEELRESEQRFASFMLHMPAAAWMKDLEGRFVYANAETARAFSTSLTGLLGKTDWDFFPPETARLFAENDSRVLSEGGSLETIEVLRQADGIEHYSLVSKFAVAGPDGKPAYIAGVAFDITERKRMEAELEHFASFPLLNPTPIMEMDSDGKVVFCNSAAEKVLGKEECFDSSNPLIPEELPDILRDLQQKKVSRFTRTVEIGDLVFDELIYLTPEFNSVRIYAMDVTERRRLEEDRSRLAAIVENSDDAIIAKTLEGIIVEWNKGAEKLYGYTASEVKGRHISMLVPADRVDEVLQFYEMIGRGEKVEHIETVRVTKDGRHIPISLSLSPIKDTNGKITGVSTIAHDITDRKRVEAVLRENEEHFRAIFEQAAVGIGEVKPDGSWLRVNRKLCEILGYTEDELKNQSHRDITHPSDRETTVKHFQHLLEGKLGKYILEKRYIRKDGSIIWVNLTVSSVCDAGGKLKYTVGIVEDISERKRAEEKIDRLNADLTARAVELEAVNKKLEDLNRELEAFNYTVAHDLRNPLNVISSYCQAIRELCGNQLGVKCKEYLQEAYKATLNMNQLIGALLDFSRLAHVELRREPLDLSTMAQLVAAELKSAEPERRVSFLIADGITDNADANMLRVVLRNLLGNAWKYTGEQSQPVIEFGSTEIDGVTAFFVRDNGPGFSMADAEIMFIPFKRLTGTAKYAGHGIGLATVERIIQRHGGKVWAVGEPGKGATFYFTLNPSQQGA